MAPAWLLLAAEEGTPSKQFPHTFIFIAAIFAIFYFLILRPQKKREQQRKNMLGSVRKNDQVTTAGGIHGIVREVTDTTVILEVDSKNNVTLKMNKLYIQLIIILQI